MNKLLLSAALAGVMAVSVMGTAQADEHDGKEKCFGVAKAGKNDCKSSDGAHSCAGQAAKDNLPTEWSYVDAGKCVSLGGKLESM